MAEMETDEKNIRAMRGTRSAPRRRRVSRISAEKIDYIDYKDVNLLKTFIADNGKIMPRRLTGVTSMQQRKLTEAIKRARTLALLPFTKY
jgi:small subunit ribosomal protein S18